MRLKTLSFFLMTLATVYCSSCKKTAISPSTISNDSIASVVSAYGLTPYKGEITAAIKNIPSITLDQFKSLIKKQDSAIRPKIALSTAHPDGGVGYTSYTEECTPIDGGPQGVMFSFLDFTGQEVPMYFNLFLDENTPAIVGGSYDASFENGAILWHLTYTSSTANWDFFSIDEIDFQLNGQENEIMNIGGQLYNYVYQLTLQGGTDGHRGKSTLTMALIAVS